MVGRDESLYSNLRMKKERGTWIFYVLRILLLWIDKFYNYFLNKFDVKHTLLMLIFIFIFFFFWNKHLYIFKILSEIIYHHSVVNKILCITLLLFLALFIKLLYIPFLWYSDPFFLYVFLAYELSWLLFVLGLKVGVKWGQEKGGGDP